jgi:Uma2 family endonuclease
LPLLSNGDCVSQPEFHRRYEQYPEDVKFELVGGIVYWSSDSCRPHAPLRWSDATYHPRLTLTLEFYASQTPGIELGDSATTILGKKSESQPDLALRISEECGGRSRLNHDDYVMGPPELVAEIARSTRAIDMHGKRDDYQRSGVLEYLVLCVEEREVHWFDFRTGSPIRPNREGVSRSRVFPGLWIDSPAVLDRNSARIIEVVRQGLATRKHASFVKRLEAARCRRR